MLLLALAPAPSVLPSGRPQPSAQIGVGAAAVIAVDLTTGIELYSENADTPLPPASTMKIVTALVAREILPLEQRVVVQEADIPDITVYSTMGLQAGDELTVDLLFQGLLIASGADAANALARAAGLRLDPASPDPIARFVQEMNAWAAQMEMRNSRFTNPVGADDPAGHEASARDLVRATRALLADRFLAPIVRTRSATVNVSGANARAIELASTNQLLERDDVFGIKTGTEDVAGQCLITGFWRGDNQIITVVLGSPDRYYDTLVLMEHVDARYRWVALGAGTRSLGATDELAAQGLTFMVRRTVLMPAEQAEAITWELDTSSGASSRRRGVVVFRTGEEEIIRLPVYSAAAGSAVTPRAA